MYQSYDKASRKIENGLPEEIRKVAKGYDYRRSARLVREYLSEKGIPYSREEAVKCLLSIKPNVAIHRYNLFRKIQFLIAEELYPGCTLQNLEIFYSDSIPDYNLPAGMKSLLGEFIQTGVLSPKGWVMKQLRIGGFLNEMVCQNSHTSVSQITWDDVALYRKVSTGFAEIGSFLNFLATKHVALPYLGAVYNHSPQRLKMYADYCKDLRYPTTHDIADVYACHVLLIRDLAAAGYSESVLNTAATAFNDFACFLYATDMGYSHQALELYSHIYREKVSKYSSHVRHPFLFLDGYLNGERFETMGYKQFRPATDFIDWFKPYADKYLKHRELDHIGNSCMKGDRNALVRFSSFLAKQGCNCTCDITRQVLKDFSQADHHDSYEGKNRYNRVIRRFLHFLFEENLINEDIGKAMPKVNVARVRPTITLTEDQYSKVLDYCSKAEESGNYLHSAILKLGLWTGLRSSDICKLGAENIDWDRMELSLIQQKTGVHIRTPFPVDLGNTIWNYITKSRPVKCEAGIIFCSSRAPFRHLSKTITNSILHKALPGESVHFHMLRKTFATRMLRSGSNVSAVSDALGHITDSTVDSYIDTNAEMMRMCSMFLHGIEYKGDVL